MKKQTVIFLAPDISEEDYQDTLNKTKKLNRTLSNANSRGKGCTIRLIVLLLITFLFCGSVVGGVGFAVNYFFFSASPTATPQAKAKKTPTPKPTFTPTPAITALAVSQNNIDSQPKKVTVNLGLEDKLGEALTTTKIIYKTLYHSDLPTDTYTLTLTNPFSNTSPLATPTPSTPTPPPPLYQIIYYNEVRTDEPYPTISGWIVNKNQKARLVPVTLKLPVGQMVYPRPNIDKLSGFYEFLLEPGEFDLIIEGHHIKHLTIVPGDPVQIEMSIQYNGPTAPPKNQQHAKHNSGQVTAPNNQLNQIYTATPSPPTTRYYLPLVLRSP